jgi:hypothetical protein
LLRGQALIQRAGGAVEQNKQSEDDQRQSRDIWRIGGHRKLLLGTISPVRRRKASGIYYKVEIAGRLSRPEFT